MTNLNNLVAFHMTLAWLFLAPSLISAENSTDKWPGCDLPGYYDPMGGDDLSAWSEEDLRDLVTSTQQDFLPDFSSRENPLSIIEALIDLWPGSEEDTVHLLYINGDLPALPNNGLENWRKELFWPESRGALTAALTDVHGTAPGDWSVLDDKHKHNVENTIFYGECGTVNYAEECVRPANVETSPDDTAQDTKIWLPPANVRGDIARGLFFYAVRYAELNLVDCPPFGANDFGYLSALLKWHNDDPVDDAERARNDRACRHWQGNRNPFIDHEDLVAEMFGEADTIQPGTLHYSQCSPETEAPTATPNPCSESIQPADVAVFGFNSVDPDQIIFFNIDFIEAGVGSLFVTNRAWDGSEFVEGSGETMELDISGGDMQAGTAFGYNAESERVVKREWEGTITLNQDGDHLLMYCINADNMPHFIHGISFGGQGWAEPNQPSYGPGESALPERLTGVGNIVLSDLSNWYYNGTTTLTGEELKPTFADPNEWVGSDVAFLIGSSAMAVSSVVWAGVLSAALALVL